MGWTVKLTKMFYVLQSGLEFGVKAWHCHHDFLRPTLTAPSLKSYAFEQAEGDISQQQSYNTDPAAHGENNLHSYFPIY